MDGFNSDYSHGLSFRIGTEGIPDIWILLDSYSTVNIFSNRILLRNIIEGYKYMNVHINELESRTNLSRELVGYPDPIWYDQKGIAQNISVALVEKHFLISYGKYKCFVLHKGCGSKCCFLNHIEGCATFTWQRLTLSNTSMFPETISGWQKNKNKKVQDCT